MPIFPGSSKEMWIGILKSKRLLWAAAATLVVFLLFFDVSLNPEFSLPAEKSVPDANQEAQFQDCFDSRDTEIHHQAFGTIDNPDVQKEFISSHRAAAEKTCRSNYPQEMVTVRSPLRVNLFDIRPRFW